MVRINEEYFEFAFIWPVANSIDVPAPADQPIPIAYPAYPNLWGIDWPTAILIALTLATALFALVAVLYPLAGIIAYLNIKRDSKKEARKVAKKIADDYIKENLGDLVAEYVKLLMTPPPSKDGDLAKAQDTPGTAGSSVVSPKKNPNAGA